MEGIPSFCVNVQPCGKSRRYTEAMPRWPFDDTVARIADVKTFPGSLFPSGSVVGVDVGGTSFAPRGTGRRDNGFHSREVDIVVLLTSAQLKQFVVESSLKTADPGDLPLLTISGMLPAQRFFIMVHRQGGKCV